MSTQSHLTLPVAPKMIKSIVNASGTNPSPVSIGKSDTQVLGPKLGSRAQSADLRLPKAINLEVTPIVPVRGRLVKRQRPSNSAALEEIDYHLKLDAQKLSALGAPRSRKYKDGSSSPSSVYSTWAKVSKYSPQHSARDDENQNIDGQNIPEEEATIDHQEWDEDTLFQNTGRKRKRKIKAMLHDPQHTI